VSAREAPAAEPIALRPFRAHGYTVQIPDSWLDLTTYAFRGPKLRDFNPVLCVQTESEVGFDSVDDYARARLPLALRASSGGRLLRQEPMRLGSTHTGVLAEIRWSPGKDQEYFQRILYALFENRGLVLSCHLTRYARAARGESIQRVFEAFRPYGAAFRSSRPSSWIGDSFRIDLPEGWTDMSTILLAEPEPDRFRRNLVIRRILEPEAPDDLRPWAENEIEILKKAAKGFELLEHKETTTADQGFAQKIVFLRDTDSGDRVRQTEVAAWREGAMHVLLATTEVEPPRRIARLIEPMLRSFSASKGGERN
jgi:hypothetical protein